MDLECDARFQCPRCENDVGAHVLLPEPVLHGENPPTAEVEIVTVECPFCREVFSARAYVTPSMCSLEFVDHPLTPISAGAPRVREVYDDWDDYDVPEDPYSILNSSLTDASVLLDERGGGGKATGELLVAVHRITHSSPRLSRKWIDPSPQEVTRIENVFDS